MKKISLLFVFVLAVLGSCTKYNEKNFEGYDEAKKPTTASAQYTIIFTDAEYSNSAFPTAVRNNKYFDTWNPLSNYADKFLSGLYTGADAGASVLITYKFVDSVPSNVRHFTDTAYLLAAADYKTIYGGAYSGINGLSPLKTPASSLPAFLKSKFSYATAGKSKIIEYDYYAEVPQSTVYLEENFEGGTNYDPTAPAGWTNQDTSEADLKWQDRSYSGNMYTQITSNGSKNQENQVWLITNQVDLTTATLPQLSFDICTGYWTGASLRVMVSSDFDGTEEGIASATWEDISSDCSLPATGNPSGYGTLTPIAAPADLTAYNGQKIYMAFVYDGKENKNNGEGNGDAADRRTTTYQIDNLKVEEKPDAPINPVKTAAAWVYDGAKWAVAENSIAFQPSDYTAAGLGSYMTSAQAPNYVPAFLNQNRPYAQNNTIITVVYKSSATLSRADQYVKQNGVWAPVAAPVEKSEQYIKTAAGEWLFDPTVTYVFSEARNNADYQLLATYVLEKWPGKYSNGTYTNEEWYYGANAYYANFNFRLTGSSSSSRDITSGRDEEFHNLTTDADKIALLWNRSKDGMNVFLQKRFPEAVKDVQGVEVYYNVTARVFYPDGKTNETLPYTWRYKCVTSGAVGVPPTFEFVNITPEPPLGQ